MSQSLYIITGSAKGLGASLARLLLGSESHVAGIARNDNADTRAHAGHNGYSYTSWIQDLLMLKEDQVQSFQERILADGSRAKMPTSVCLINNAATVAPLKPIERCENAEIRNGMQTNLIFPMLLTSSFIKLTERWDAARTVVNISSGSARFANAGMSVYSSSKAALHMFSESIRLEQVTAQRPVSILSFDPGMFDTGMQEMARNTSVSDLPITGYFKEAKETGKLEHPDVVAATLIKQIKESFR